MHADFIQPVEGFYKINPKRRDDFLKYDLILQSEDIGFEMRFWLDRKYRQGAPQVSAFTLASSLATNNSHFDLHMNLFPEALAEDYFNADWAAYVDFIPKMHLTDHNYGRLLCLYRQDLGMMYNLMLFDQHDDEKDRRLYTLVFSDYPAQ